MFRGIEDRSRDFYMRTSFSRLIGVASSHGGAVGGVANDAGAESMQGVQPQECLSAIEPRRKIGPAEIHQSGLASLSHPLASWIEA